MIIPVNPPKDVTVVPAVPAVTTNATEVDIKNINDNTVNAVVALVTVNGYDKVLTLWDDGTVPTYQQIGNWTQEQANERVVELL
jgi:hypothetical protein